MTRNLKYYTITTALALGFISAGIHTAWRWHASAEKRQTTDQAAHVAAHPAATAYTPETATGTPAVSINVADASTSAAVPESTLPPPPHRIQATTPTEPSTESGEKPRTVTETLMILDATPIPALHASLNERYPSARTIEPVAIPSLADLLVEQRVPERPINRLQIPAPNGEVLEIDVLQHQEINARRGTITGTVAAVDSSNVIISYCEEAISASVIIPGKIHYEIAYAGNGYHVLLDIDPAKILPNAPPLLPRIEIVRNSHP
jgi:hypothetical protein